MSYYNGPKIVTSGLYLCVDAGNGKSYSGAGSAFTDMCGINNLTITGATYRSTTGSFFFNNPTNNFNVNDYIRQPSNNTNFAMNLTVGCSAFCFFNNTSYLDGAAPSYFRQTPMAFGFDSTIGGWQIERFTTETNYNLRYKFDQEGLYGSNFSYGTVDLNKWYQLGFTMNRSTLTLYKNGAVVNTLNVSSKTITGSIDVNACFALGSSGYNGGTPFYGYIGNVSNAQFYTRFLTDAEVVQNYNTLKSRFNL